MSIFISSELEQALRLAGRCLKVQLPAITGLSFDILEILILQGDFPPCECHPKWGPSWSLAEVERWVQRSKSTLQ